MSHVLEDAPLILIENGVVHEDRMTRMKIRLDDILENGRLDEGVERTRAKAQPAAEVSCRPPRGRYAASRTA